MEKRLDTFIRASDQIEDSYLQSHLARYLAILTSGYFEKVIQLLVVSYCQKRSGPEIVKFVSKKIAWEGSINRAKLKKILDDFDDKLYVAIENMADDTSKSAVDSIKDLRDQLAHGGDNGTSYGTVKVYHLGVRKYAQAIGSAIGK